MAFDWGDAISQLWHWQKQLAQLDTSGKNVFLDQYSSGPMEKIFEAQQAVGTQFPRDFGEFLCHLDGYRGFLHHTEIFGTRQFLDGQAKVLRQLPRVKDFCARWQLEDEDVVPMGTNDDHSVVLMLFAPTCEVLPGGVVGLMRDGRESHAESFTEFFLAVTKETKRKVMELTKGA